jgi:co-chaperonin GroES (HSP10)|tara:strand:- start:1613 stop:1870 length:258 start_codon:yes stop_codon:yes gene_type:complete
MQAVNDYVIVDKINEGPKKVGGLLLTDETDESNRYRKANIISVGNDVPIVKKGDCIYYDGVAGHDIAYNDTMYRVIRARDIVIVE